MTLGLRLVASYVVVVVLTLGVITFGAARVIQDERNEISSAQLDTDARSILAELRSSARNQINVAELMRLMGVQAQTSDTYILFGNADGEIVQGVSPDGNLRDRPTSVSSGLLPHELTEVERGSITIDPGGDLNYVAYPLGRLLQARNFSNLNTLIIAKPGNGFTSVLDDLGAPLLWAGIAGLAASIVVAGLMTWSVYRPLKRLTRATEAMLHADQDVEAVIPSSRELSGLSESISRMANQARVSNQRLRYFVADVSHQLRNPLTSIRGFAQAILDGTAEDTESVHKAAEVIGDESDRMMRQVEQLLELARMQSGQVSMEKKAFNANELLDHCQEVFEFQAAEKNVALKLDVDPLPPVLGDIDRTEQVFVNLIDNAIKHSPIAGEVLIKGRWADAGSVQISISDSGPGIPPEELSRVFERFYRADGPAGGTGLGLAIAREIVLAQGGEIKVFSRPGEGTDFVVSLPTGPTPGG